ncbi:MAG: mediator complex subunit [Peltula sp. TS41687]|nr:MAG: mediator complex subunit [Peltula sp. TS41687]
MPLLMDDSLDIDELFGDDSALPLPHVPPPKGLAQRVDELRTIGCCQKVTWSRYNSVACITRDGRGVIVRHLLRSPEDGRFTLGQPYPVPRLTNIHQGVQLSHLLWNQGRILELAVVDVLGRISISNIVAINRLAPSRLNISDQEDDLSAVVGMMWLNGESNVPWYRSANKNGGQFHYDMAQHKPMGPYAPKNRSALICITRGGILRLLYSQADGRWTEVKTNMDFLTASDDVLSHASFCAYRAGAENNLLLVVRTLSRKYRVYRIQINWHPPGTEASAAQPPLPVTPVISIQNWLVALSTLEETQYSSRLANDASQLPPQLSHLELLPAGPPSKHSASIFPTILMVFTHLQGPQSPGYRENYSVFVRWALQPVVQRLHPQFDQLNSTKESIGSFQQIALDMKRLDDMVVERTFLSLQQLGTGLSTALSPNYCVALNVDDESEQHLRVMQCSLEDIGTSKEDDKFQAIVTALAMQIASAVNTFTSRDDDILLAIQRLSNPSIEHGVLNELYRALNQSADHSFDSQHDKLARNLNLMRCFSLQETFGHQLERSHRNLTSKVARTTLDFRLVTLTFTYAFFSGEIKNASRQVIPNDFTKPIQRTSSCALPLLLSSMPRCLLRHSLHCLNIFHTTATKRLPHEHSAPQRSAFLTLLSLIESAPTKAAHFHAVLAQLDKAIQIAYQDASTSEHERALTEKHLFTACHMPRTLLPVIAGLFQSTLPRLLKGVEDPAPLFFRDFGWLGLADDRVSRECLAKHPVDVMRKIPLGRRGKGPGEVIKLRRCIRCAERMEYVVVVGMADGAAGAAGTGAGGAANVGASGAQAGSNAVSQRTGNAQGQGQGQAQQPLLQPQVREPFWMAQLQKTCVCGNLWMLE